MSIKRIFSKNTLKEVGLFLESILDSLPDVKRSLTKSCQHCPEVLNQGQNFCRSCNQPQVSLSEVYSLASGFNHYSRIIQLTAALIVLLVGCYVVRIQETYIYGFLIINLYFIVLIINKVVSASISDWSAHDSSLEDALLSLKLSKIKLFRTAIFWPLFLIMLGVIFSTVSSNRPLIEDMTTYLSENNLNSDQQIQVSDHTVITFFKVAQEPYTTYVGVWNQIIPIHNFKLRQAGIDPSALSNLHYTTVNFTDHVE